MRAVRFDRFGPVDVLEVRDVPEPEAGPGEVVVRVKAAAINPGEVSIRAGVYATEFPSVFPEGEGSDLAGVVTATGGHVGTVRVGDEVIGFTNARASHAEYVAIPETQLTAKPPQLTWEVAGALFVAGTSGRALVDAAAVGSGEVVVVSAAAGGTGTFATQLARNAGARVIALAGPGNAERLRRLCLTPLDYHGADLDQRIAAAAAGPVDALIDTHGGGYVELGLRLGIAPRRIVSIADFGAAAVGAQVVIHTVAARADVLASLAADVAAERIEVPIAAVFPLGAVRDAYRLLETGHTRGKIVLQP